MAIEKFRIERNRKIDPNSKQASLTIVLENRDGSTKTPEEVKSFINKYIPFFKDTEPGQFARMKKNVLEALQAWSDTHPGDERERKLSEFSDYFNIELAEKTGAEKVEQETLFATDDSEYVEDDEGNRYLVDGSDFPNY